MEREPGYDTLRLDGGQPVGPEDGNMTVRDLRPRGDATMQQEESSTFAADDSPQMRYNKILEEAEASFDEEYKKRSEADENKGTGH